MHLTSASFLDHERIPEQFAFGAPDSLAQTPAPAVPRDVEKLVALIQNEVEQRFSVRLTPEFRIAGEAH